MWAYHCVALRAIKTPPLQSPPITIKDGAPVSPEWFLWHRKPNIQIFVICVGNWQRDCCISSLLELLLTSGTECVCWGQHALKLIGHWFVSRLCSCGLLKQFLVFQFLFCCYSPGNRTYQSICARSQDTLLKFISLSRYIHAFKKKRAFKPIQPYFWKA